MRRLLLSSALLGLPALAAPAQAADPAVCPAIVGVLRVRIVDGPRAPEGRVVLVGVVPESAARTRAEGTVRATIELPRRTRERSWMLTPADRGRVRVVVSDRARSVSILVSPPSDACGTYWADVTLPRPS